MANKDAPFGLRYVRNLQGNYNSSGQSKYRLTTADATNTTSIYQGDIVTQNTAGIVTRIARADGGSATSDIIVGVFNGCFYTDPTTSKPTWSNYWPGSGADSNHPIKAFVIDDPMAIFEIQADAAFPVADLFGNFDIVYTSSGSTTTGISGAELDVTTGATTATLPLKAIDISKNVNNDDVSSDATNVLVVIQNHIFGQKSAGLA